MATDVDGNEIIVMVPVSVTCSKTGCVNAGKTISIEMAEGGTVVCGPCGSDITPDVPVA